MVYVDAAKKHHEYLVRLEKEESDEVKQRRLKTVYNKTTGSTYKVYENVNLYSAYGR